MTAKKITLLAVTLFTVIISDQFTKRYIASVFQLYESKEVIPNFFHITYILNKGAAFGFLSGSDSSLVTPFFIIITLVAGVVLFWMFFKAPPENWVFLVGLSLLLSGAIGNFIDRVLMGEVIDFIDVHWFEYHWPTFNIADSAISIGVFLLLIDILKGEREGEETL